MHDKLECAVQKNFKQRTNEKLRFNALTTTLLVTILLI